MTLKQKIELAIYYGIQLIILIYGIFCIFLYFQQAIYTGGEMYASDLAAHIDMATNQNYIYSVTGVIIWLFFSLPYSYELTAIFLSIVTVATIVATYILLQELLKKYAIKCSRNIIWIIALACNFFMPFFVKNINPTRYLGYQSPSIWHNSTYLCMKLVACITLIIFLRLIDTYYISFKKKDWSIFSGMLLLSCLVKPSFLTIFAPAMAIFMLFELIRKVEFKRIVVMGLTLLPSVIILFIQSLILFDPDTNQSIFIKFGVTLRLFSERPVETLVLSCAFPLLVLTCTIIEKRFFDKYYLLAWAMWGIGLIQVVFLNESGERFAHGNFLWGYYFGIFFLVILSCIKLIEIYFKPKGIFKNSFLKKVMMTINMFVFSYQVWCGIYFFKELIKGRNFRM